MPAPFRPLSVRQFLDEIRAFPWSRLVWRVDLHHTETPAIEYRGLSSIEAIAAEHLQRRRHPDIAQAEIAHHVAVAPDGVIWTGRDWNKSPSSIGCGMNVGVFMVALIGNFDRGCDRLRGAQFTSTLAVIDGVQHRFRLPVQALLFPREVPQTDTTSPGSGIAKQEMLWRLQARRQPNGGHGASAVA